MKPKSKNIYLGREKKKQADTIKWPSTCGGCKNFEHFFKTPTRGWCLTNKKEMDVGAIMPCFQEGKE